MVYYAKYIYLEDLFLNFILFHGKLKTISISVCNSELDPLNIIYLQDQPNTLS